LTPGTVTVVVVAAATLVVVEADGAIAAVVGVTDVEVAVVSAWVVGGCVDSTVAVPEAQPPTSRTVPRTNDLSIGGRLPIGRVYSTY
jgi:hypothetical protein